MPQPRDPELYDKIKKIIYKRYPKHSAYRSGHLVRTYKQKYAQKYGNGSPYVGSKSRLSGLSRWYREDWRNQRGEVGYKYKSDVYRPTRRITKKTPLTFSELNDSEISRARRIKSRSRRVDRFRYHQSA